MATPNIPSTSSIQDQPTCEAIVSYKKKLGKLQLSKAWLRWIPKDGAGSGLEVVSIELGRLQSLYASRDGGPKVMLKICAKVVTSDTTSTGEPIPDESFNFTFSSPTNALPDRETFKREISQQIVENRAAKEQPAPAVPASEDASDARPADEKGKAVHPLQDWRLKKRVLQNDPELRQLHKDMVIGGQISEGEFWDGREELLYHEARLESQRRGRSAQMVDPRPETTDAGEIMISITPQMIRDIFEQYPVVQKAYNENVPPLNDQKFWTRYFRSKLFNRHRSSARQSGDAVKEDEIFDKYLGDDDDGIEPKNIKVHEVNRLLDLAATQEDHVETGNLNDWTMRAGTQRSALPLMRRFNEHSQRLLDSSLGKMPERRAGGVIDGGDAGSRNYYGETDLEDLNAQVQPERVLLDMQGQERYFEGSAGVHHGVKRQRTAEEEEECINKLTNRLTKGWNLNLGRFQVHGEHVSEATHLMMDNVTKRYEQKHGLNEGSIPANFLSQVVSTHTTTNEFLRQFWTAMLPSQSNPAAESSTAKVLTAEQKALKAQRMIGYLEKTPERIQSLIGQAEKIGVPTKAVLQALEGVIRADEAAKKYYRDRLA